MSARMAELGAEMAAAATAPEILPADWSESDTLTSVYGRTTYQRVDGWAVIDCAPSGRTTRDDWRVIDERGVTPADLPYRCLTMRQAMDLLDRALPLTPTKGGE